MRRSSDRLVTSHTGSLPRPPDLIELLRRKEQGEELSTADFEARISQAVDEVVHRQVTCGIDLPSDGEQGKPGYATYIKDRVSGFGPKRGGIAVPHQEARDFPEYTARRAAIMSSILTPAV